jgi:hypothetical protein
MVDSLFDPKRRTARLSDNFFQICFGGVVFDCGNKWSNLFLNALLKIYSCKVINKQKQLKPDLKCNKPEFLIASIE